MYSDFEVALIFRGFRRDSNRIVYTTCLSYLIDRQRCTPDEVKNNSLWSKYMFPKPFAPTTLKSYKSRFIKIVYCSVDDVHLEDMSYSLDKEFDSIENQTLLIDRSIVRLVWRQTDITLL